MTRDAQAAYVWQGRTRTKGAQGTQLAVGDMHVFCKCRRIAWGISIACVRACI